MGNTKNAQVLPQKLALALVAPKAKAEPNATVSALNIKKVSVLTKKSGQRGTHQDMRNHQDLGHLGTAWIKLSLHWSIRNAKAVPLMNVMRNIKMQKHWPMLSHWGRGKQISSMTSIMVS